MREVGTVVEIDAGDVKLSLTRTDACSKCKACSVSENGKEMVVAAKNLCNAKPGDKVIIELDPSIFIQTAFITYGFPLFMMIAGFFVGQLLNSAIIKQNDDIISFVFGIAAMLASFIIIKLNDTKIRQSRFKPNAIELYDENEDETYDFD